MEQYTCHGEGSNIAESIRDGITTIISNGAYYPTQRYGTVSWDIDIQHTVHKLWTWKHVPGTVLNQDLYRSKLSGLLGGIFTINKICDVYQITYFWQYHFSMQRFKRYTKYFRFPIQRNSTDKEF